MVNSYREREKGRRSKKALEKPTKMDFIRLPTITNEENNFQNKLDYFNHLRMPQNFWQISFILIYEYATHQSHIFLFRRKYQNRQDYRWENLESLFLQLQMLSENVEFIHQAD